MDSQTTISREIDKIHASARPGLVQPILNFAPLSRSSVHRHQTKVFRTADLEAAELVAPAGSRRKWLPCTVCRRPDP